MQNPAIEVQNLCKTFHGKNAAVSGLDFEVPQGSVYGLIGRNGSGKTTTLRLVMGLLKPDAGKAHSLGYELWKAPREVRQRVAYVSQNQRLPGWMNLEDLSRYVGSMYDRWDLQFAKKLTRQWDISWKVPVSRLSLGEQRMVALTLALAARPKVMILDEPAAGLDPVARRELLSALIEVTTSETGCAILISSHHIEDMERLAEWIGVMDRGRMAISDKLETLIERVKRVQVILPEGCPPPEWKPSGAYSMQIRGSVMTAVLDLESPATLARFQKIKGARIQLFDLGLEELFLEICHRQKVDNDSHEPSNTHQETYVY
jgi:ABC-2 type transport system ATP-binding protein